MQLDIDKILKLESNDLTYKLDNIIEPVVLYGAGVLGKRLIQICRNQGIEPILCDSNEEKINSDGMGIKVSSFEDILKKHKKMNVIICSMRFFKEIESYLLQYIPKEYIFYLEDKHIFDGVWYEPDVYHSFLLTYKEQLNGIFDKLEDEKSKEVMSYMIKAHYTGNISCFEEIYSPDQYFPEGIIKLNEEEVFVDGGAYVGDTLEKFIEKVDARYKRTYSFEPTKAIFDEMVLLKENKYQNDPRIQLFQKGLHSQNQTIGFMEYDEQAYSNTIIDNDEGARIEVVAVDQVIDEEVTFIKLDIEGAEIEALKGARNTILKSKPKLAISIYHKYDDILTIPEYIMSLGLDYKLYLRHHGRNSCETVLYAV